MRNSLFCLLLISLISCGTPEEPDQQGNQSSLSIDYEKMTLDNGLEVVFHQDHSDPVVAVALTFHVGSAREKPGKTGFAHLFEHLFFLESENLGRGGLDKMSSRIGGSGANGSTSRDRTNYFQTVPKDALEKMIWAEADKVGYFINTVTDEVLNKEKQVVKNEKRQGADNQPYGHTNYVVTKNLYPEGHPYSWEVIGTLEDLQNSTLEDVKEFHGKYYGPNNATLVIAGDFELEEAKELVRKYFEEIPKGQPVESMDPQPVVLEETKKLYYEDNFARLPMLQMVWPTVEMYHQDAYALEILSEILSQGKSSPFNKVLVEEDQVTSNVNTFANSSELAGEFRLMVRAYPGTDLDSVYQSVNKAFERFETEGFTEQDLSRIKAGIETNYYNGLSSVLGKAFQLAQYNIFADDPGYVNEDINKTLQVTKEDVQRVYDTYIHDKNFVATSFVPKGSPELALTGSDEAEVIEEKIVAEGAGEAFEQPGESEYTRTFSSFDRTVEPAYGESPDIRVPEIWRGELENGLKIYGIDNKELPLVQFNIYFKGGLMLEDPGKTGVSNLLAEMLMNGTKEKTPEELEESIDALGAQIRMRSGSEGMTLSVNTLARNFPAVMDLVEEILLEPRWDTTEFRLSRQEIISDIEQAKSNPNAVAGKVFRKVVYGDHILSMDVSGTVESVQEITMDDLKEYYKRYLVPNVAAMHVVGSINDEGVMNELNKLETDWQVREVEFPEARPMKIPENSTVYFYDIPGAKQSVLNFGYLAMPETHPDYWPATIMNYKLGGGGFASRLMQELREGKGYTYGIGSGFSGSDIPGPFSIGSGVRTNVTFESADLIRQILADYADSYSEKDLEDTKSYFIKSNARAFETAGAKLNMLEKLSRYGWSAEYVTEREEIVKSMTTAQISELARTYADPEHMIYIIAGDAETQLDRLKDLGFGEPVLIRDLESIPLEPEM